jgi:hypothetical protein
MSAPGGTGHANGKEGRFLTYSDIRRKDDGAPGLRTSVMPQFGNSGGKIRQTVAIARHTFRDSPFKATSARSAGS